MEKTAVEWLIDRINKVNHDYEVGITDEGQWSIETYEAHTRAKEMEKQQIIDAFKRGTINEMNGIEEIDSEQYYNETFKQQEQ
jgi:hypothetical protein